MPWLSRMPWLRRLRWLRRLLPGLGQLPYLLIWQTPASLIGDLNRR
jgi:hypothetical protein